MLIVDKAKWYSGADVVVAGYGAAGAVAAITARDLGADVLILEKQPAQSHVSNSFMSGGVFISPSDVKVTEQYLRALCHVDKDISWTDSEIMKVWSEYICQNRQWMQQMGGVFSELGKGGSHREIRGNDLIGFCGFNDRGRGMMNFLKSVVAQRKIQVMHQVRAKRLIANHRGEVIGVAAEKDGAEINIKAARAVILTTGGFEFDDMMKLQYLRCYPYYFDASPANTGDGVRMAMGVGAELWHMNCSSAGFTMKFPEMPFGFAPLMRGKDRGLTAIAGYGKPTACGYIIVDKSGHRFINENFKTHHANYELTVYDTRAMNFPRIPSYWIMDHTRIADGPLPNTQWGSAGTAGFYQWSADNKKEIEKDWIFSAESVKELGQKLGVDPDNLHRTVENYNSYCRNHDDLELRRRPESLVLLDTPPYYAVKVWPGGPNTQGGPRRNHKAQVLSVEGGTIPGLYAAGELGSVYGMLYTGGGNLAECIAFGRIAGENAAKEKPRSIA